MGRKSVKSRLDVTEPALLNTWAAMLTSVAPAPVDTLPTPLTDTVPKAPAVRLTDNPLDAIAPTTAIPPLVAVLSVFARVKCPRRVQCADAVIA